MLETTVALVKTALDSDIVKHRVLAHNIANANSTGYVPYQLNFDSRLEQLQSKIKTGGPIYNADLSALFPRVERNLLTQGLNPKVALDLEAAKLGGNVLHYQAVIRAYNQMTLLLGIAIKEGRQ